MLRECLPLQVYDESGRHFPATSAGNLSQEATVLQKSFPSADPEALMNALAVCDNNIESAKAVRPCLHGSTALLGLLSTAKAEACSQYLPEAAFLMRCCCV